MNTNPSLDELFEKRLSYPDFDVQERLERLVGLDEQKSRLSKLIGTLINPKGLKDWISKYHQGAEGLLTTTLRRPPLIILAGDVGAGKTELAETIGDMVARQEDIDISLFPMSLSTRGRGRVGEMTQLISSAFEVTVSEAQKLKSENGDSRGGIILLVDEADALAQSRESDQMHHEDKAGVNAFIRGIDRLAKGQMPAAVIMCTNRLGSLDPAIKRRAADILSFTRPNEQQRMSVLSNSFAQLGFSSNELNLLVKVTGPSKGREYGFTFSDLNQRLIPSVVLDAYPSNAVKASRAYEIAISIDPTSPFKDA